ncbi:Thioesterase superfamily [Lasiodiplodia theobromae]|uniref:Krueppel-like factor 17 n=1 Tax=Lasiodiplodia theobromae TaxID=45133 RepID=A0A5N5DCM5_9PEZI|nr:Krueppel-like factor 17 [Lasiodiplodia theobromae]KAF9639224.1 Thioesterase superfamily [Lasiodiplodia theobromae]
MSHEPRAKRRKVAADDPQAVFRCEYPGCGSAYRRKEHLNRHAQQHTKEPRYSCNYCARKFFRRDILRRHLELHDEDIELTRSRTAKACDVCRSRKTRCDGNTPCRTCSEKSLACTYGQGRANTAPAPVVEESTRSDSATPTPTHPYFVENFDDGQLTPRALLPQPQFDDPTVADLSYATQHFALDASMLVPNDFSLDSHTWANFPNLATIRRHVSAYWQVFHLKWLFLHKASFRPEQEPPFLLLSMVTASLWVGGGIADGCDDQAARVVAVDLHRRLMVMLYQQRDKWDVNPPAAWPLGTLQGILIHLILAASYGLPLSSPTGCTADPARNTQKLLADLVCCCRRLSAFDYPTIMRQFGKQDLALVTWVRVEEVKRLVVVLWKICDWVGDGGEGALLSWSELRFQAPEPDELWTAEGIKEFLARRERCGLSGKKCDDEENWICNVLGAGNVATPRA